MSKRKKHKPHNDKLEFDLVVRDGYDPIIKLKNQRIQTLNEVLAMLNKKVGGRR